MSKHPIKLTASEVAHLAALLAAVARPRSHDEVDDVEHWLRRLAVKS